jgi:hypothetical protein
MNNVPDPLRDVSDPMSDGPKVVDRNNPFGETPGAAAARRRRNLVLAVGLIVFAVLIFVVTMSRLKSEVLAGGHL